jgi:hypothetical protein
MYLDKSLKTSQRDYSDLLSPGFLLRYWYFFFAKGILREGVKKEDKEGSVGTCVFSTEDNEDTRDPC